MYFTLGWFTGSYSTSLRGVFHLCVMLECFPGTQSSSRGGVLTCTLRQEVSRVLILPLYEVCFTCVYCYNVSQVPSQALEEVC